jgi:hypothetical protein
MTATGPGPYLRDREVTHMDKSVKERQEPLRKRYRTAPSEAWIVDRARTEPAVGQDPFHATLVAGEEGRQERPAPGVGVAGVPSPALKEARS